MLNIRFTAPLSNSRHALGNSKNTSSPSSTSKFPGAPHHHRHHRRRWQTTSASSSQHQGRHEGHSPNVHEQKNIDSQKHAYNTITESWNVPRTSLNHFPPETQRHIRENKRGERPTSPASNSTTNGTTSPLQSSLAKTLQVLAYESKAGYINFQGKSGEHFTDWMANTLRALSSDLTRAGRENLAQQCQVLNKQFISGYGALVGGSRERQTAVAEMTAALTTLRNDLLQPQLLQQKQKQQSGNSYSNNKTNTNAAVDVDAEAAEAHAEETAATNAPDAPNATATSSFTKANESAAAGEVGTGVNDPGIVDLGDGYVMLGNRRVKASTIAFRQSFAQAAALQQASSSATRLSDLSNGEQRTSQWLSLRERRLTASAFSKALGFFPGDRESLWEEKVGLRAPFAGNEATSWGTRMEPEALSTYESLTGQRVESCMFRVKHDDPPHGWLGASPDGLVQGLEICTNASTTPSSTNKNTSTIPRDNTNVVPSPHNITTSASNSSLVLGQGPGILEIKCPYNKGRPELAVPPQRAIWYYMPQLQGLMDIFDRQWCSLYVWTQAHGSASFQVKRNEEYWAAAFEILAEFWWGHVVPARQAHDAGATREEIEAYRPRDEIEGAEMMRRWSKQLAAEAPGTFYPPK